jgi:tetratricopeptide (TPR) repeat protein
LGTVAEERRDLVAAETWYKKSLDINLKQGNEHGAAMTYHQLGMVAEERWDFTAAEDSFKRALDTFKKFNDDYSIKVVEVSLSRLNNLRSQDPISPDDNSKVS